MLSTPRAPRSGILLTALVALFAVSGGTSLIYEVVWARQLHLVFGTSQLAVCTVLAAFMAGLALGGLAAAKWASRVSRPLLAYAALEVFIGLYALAFPALIGGVKPLYLGFWRAFEPGPAVYGMFQFVLMGALLLPPTMCMGATLPLLARYASNRPAVIGRRIGRLYGVNTLGAVVGTAWAGFVLLPSLGLTATTWATVAANMLIAVAAVALSFWSRPLTSAPAPEAEPKIAPETSRMPTLLVVAALAGFCALLYEVAWFRLMVLVLGGSTYAFSTMLLAFLLGIGIGGWAGGADADRTLRRSGMPGLLRRLACFQAAIAVLAWAAMYAYGELPFAFVWVYDHIEHTPGLLFGAKLLLALAIMLPPAVFMGATFPYLAQAAAGSAAPLSRPVGRLYAANTIGASAGVVAAGFMLLPALHVRGTVLAAASLNVVTALFIVAAAMPVGQVVARRRLVAITTVAAVAIALAHAFRPPWDPLLMTSGMYKYVAKLDDRTREGVLGASVRPYELLFYDEGLSSVVTVARDRTSGNIWLAHNGKIDASSLGDRETQVLSVHLPFAFRPRAEQVLVIGLASGISAGSATLHESPVRIDIVEIEPAVIPASHIFDEVNHRPLEDPRVRLYCNDARNHLELAADGTYDLVTSEPSNPWLTGVSSLFTREFFSLGKRKMTPDGVWAQWLHTYGMKPDDLRSLLGTFSDIYADVRLFRINASDLILVGSDASLPLSAAALEALLADVPRAAEELAGLGMKGPADILALYQLDRASILALTGGIELNTDDNMRIEYSAPLHLHASTRVENTCLIRSAAEVPLDAVDGARQLADLAAAYVRKGDLRRARIAIGFAQAQAADDPEVAALAEALHQVMLLASGAVEDRQGRVFIGPAAAIDPGD